MCERQKKFKDLPGNSSFSESWVSEDGNSFPTQQRTQSSLPVTNNFTNNSDVDHGLYNDLAEIIPLVQSLIDGNTRSSFAHRCSSMVYTKMPSRESLAGKITGLKGRKTAQCIPRSNKKDQENKDQEEDREDSVILKRQVEDLQRKLSEKDELLKSAENSKVQLNFVNDKIEELKRNMTEKESLLKSVELQLSDVKIKLADKQAALEKSQWEAMTHNKKAAKLRGYLDSMQGELSSFTLLIESLKIEEPGSYDLTPYDLEQLPYIDDLDEMEAQRMEEARKVYIAAVAAAKEKRDEESIASASCARLHLQSLVFRSKGPTFDQNRSSMN